MKTLIPVLATKRNEGSFKVRFFYPTNRRIQKLRIGENKNDQHLHNVIAVEILFIKKTFTNIVISRLKISQAQAKRIRNCQEL